MERTKTEKIKMSFETYFDGCYGVEAHPNTSNTYAMGICKLEFNEKENMLDVHLRRPGLLIGKAGIIINELERHLDCKIKIIEVKKF